jgi:hypothetical protein
MYCWGMSHLAPIYAAWDDNAEALAADIGEPGVKVRQWRNRNNIPSDYWPRIIEAAAKRGWVLEWKQFIRPAIGDEGQTHDATSAINDDAGGWWKEDERIVLCAVCERRTDDPTVRGCTAMDCPHSERMSELVSPAPAAAVDQGRLAA